MAWGAIKQWVLTATSKAQTAHLPGLAPPGSENTTAARAQLEKEKRRRMMAANTVLGANTYPSLGSGLLMGDE